MIFIMHISIEDINMYLISFKFQTLGLCSNFFIEYNIPHAKEKTIRKIINTNNVDPAFLKKLPSPLTIK
jgi:hypothetical protein